MRDSFKDLNDKEYAELIWGDSMKSLSFKGANGRRVFFIKTWRRIKEVNKDKFYKY